jgi:hypothetical protein
MNFKVASLATAVKPFCSVFFASWIRRDRNYSFSAIFPTRFPSFAVFRFWNGCFGSCNGSGFARPPSFRIRREEVVAHLGKPSWARADVALSFRPRNAGALRVSEVSTGADRILVVSAGFYYDARLLKAMAEKSATTLLVDSAPPLECVRLWKDQGGVFGAAALLEGDWLSRQDHTAALMDQLSSDAATGRIEACDAARQPTYVMALRKHVWPVFFSRCVRRKPLVSRETGGEAEFAAVADDLDYVRMRERFAPDKSNSHRRNRDCTYRSDKDCTEAACDRKCVFRIRAGHTRKIRGRSYRASSCISQAGYEFDEACTPLSSSECRDARRTTARGRQERLTAKSCRAPWPSPGFSLSARLFAKQEAEVVEREASSEGFFAQDVGGERAFLLL